MNILVIGNGGREHALAWKIRQSPECQNLFFLPGNAGTNTLGINIAGNPLDFIFLNGVIEEHDISMVVCGPEDPISEGIEDYLRARYPNVMVIAPSQKASQLESSKLFAKEFMKKYKIPTAAYEVCTEKSLSQGFAFLEKMSPPFVLKADGLCAGKGVIITSNLEEAKQTLEKMLSGQMFGEAGKTVLIESFLKGIEFSGFVLTNGRHYVTLPFAKDYKRIGEGDTGLNTGGMGAISPVSFLDDAFLKKVQNKIIDPTIKGLEKENLRYNGFLFFGLIKVGNEPFVIEYNCRLGDPETEAILPRLENDIVGLFIATINKTLDQIQIKTSPLHTATVILASKGYPETYEKGKTIDIPTLLPPHTINFYAGMTNDNHVLKTSGGRVMAICSIGKELNEALERTYDFINQVQFEGKTFRKDIGKDLL